MSTQGFECPVSHEPRRGLFDRQADALGEMFHAADGQSPSLMMWEGFRTQLGGNNSLDSRLMEKEQ